MSRSAAPASPFRGYRFPPEIISHAVWLYHRFALSHRDVEELLAERGIQVSYEAIRLWCRKFGPLLAGELRRRHRRRRGDKWFLDEVALTMNRRRYWLWRAVDQDGIVLDVLVQGRCDQHAAEQFLRRVLDGEGAQPRVIVTDKLASYVPAIKRVLPNSEHRRHKRLNNRALKLASTRADVSEQCNASSRLSRRSSSWRPSARCATTFGHGGTRLRPSTTARSCATDSSSGWMLWAP